MNNKTALCAALAALTTTFPLTAQEPDIVDTAVAAGSFKTLVAAVGAAELTDVLRSEGPFTVFAPTDEAFEALPEGTVENLLRPENKAELARILKYHVVAGRVTAAGAAAAGSAKSLIDQELEVRIADGQLKVGSAAIVTNDIETSNGIIHVIDAVLLPAGEPAVTEEMGPAAKAEQVLLLAIERGVPLFNEDQIAACCAVYEIAVRSVLELGGANLPEEALASLRTGLADAAEASNDRSVAWALRYGMNGAVQALRSEIEQTPPQPKGLIKRVARQGQDVFLFNGEDEARWFTLNDDVMGGISKSRASTTEDQSLLFEGRLSLENNGGFASARSRDYDMELGGVDAFMLRVLGDGRSYRFGARTGSRWGGGSWRVSFDTVAGEWTEVLIPVSDLRYSFFGRESSRGRLDPADIRGLSLTISDKNDQQPFRLEVDSIRALRAEG